MQGGNTKSVTVTVKDRNATDVGHSNKLQDSLTLNNAHLWWPYTESQEFGYLYTLEVKHFFWAQLAHWVHIDYGEKDCT